MNDLNDLLADESTGSVRELLLLVSRGHVAIAEIHRLSDLIPSVFLLSNRLDQQKYAELLPDFTYFSNADQFEKRVEQQETLHKTDVELKSNFSKLLGQFYAMFESIQQYVFDLRRLLDELDDGVHVQQTIDSVLNESEGRQLLCESVYICGLLLLILDFKFPGNLRERLLVAHFRYSAHQTKSECNVDDVCKLIRSTGFNMGSVNTFAFNSARRPAQYPVEYFRRTQLKYEHLILIVNSLRSDDLYNQLSIYPLSKQPTTTLTTQAAMLFVILYFVPDILNNHNSVMREISDRFFADNYVLSVHMGLIFNLVDAWDGFRAAKSALSNTLETNTLKTVASQCACTLNNCSEKIKFWLTEGNLSEHQVLTNANKLFRLIRDTNVSTRWALLHTYNASAGNNQFDISASSGKKIRQLRDVITNEMKFDHLFVFEILLGTAQLEQNVEQTYRNVLTNKANGWNKYRMDCHERCLELAEVFAGKRSLTRMEPNSKLEQWFVQFADQLQSLQLDQNDNEKNNKKILKLIKALNQVREFRQLESNVQVKQLITECEECLQMMHKTNLISEHYLQNLSAICELSYGWELIRVYTPYMQKQIKKDANSVIKLKAAFLKLSSVLDVPLLRIHQANSDQLENVSKYYSAELVRYVRDVLHVIPESLFEHMEAIVRLQTNTIQVMPTHLRKDQLNAFAHTEDRSEVAKLTYMISMLTQGLLSMRTTLFGVIRIDASRLLEDGIRRELVKQLSKALHMCMTFTGKQKAQDLIRKLEQLCIQMDGYRRSFEYMQDYVCIYGLKIWQEELTRVFNYHVEQECNLYSAQKVMGWDSLYQNKYIPIPLQESSDPTTVTFMGRLVKEILRLTDPKVAIFVFQMSTWYDCKTHTDIIDRRFFKLLNKGVSVAGLNGMDKLLSFLIIEELENLNKIIGNHLNQNENWNESIHKILDNLNNHNSIDIKFCNNLAVKFAKIIGNLNDSIGRIGQMQILKMCICHELNSSGKFEANQLNQTLHTLNNCVLNSIRHKSNLLDQKEESVFLYELANLLEWNGISDTFSKVYANIRQPQHVEIICFLLLLHQLPKYSYCKQTQSLISRKLCETGDGNAYVIGFISWLAQFAGKPFRKLFFLIGQHVMLVQSENNKEISADAIVFCLFLQMFVFYGKIPKAYVEKHIPNCILDNLHSIMKASRT